MFKGIAIDIAPALDVLEVVQDTALQSPGLMKTAFRRTAVRISKPRVLRKIKGIEPGKPIHPLDWTSRKQQRFVMAKLREEDNLPYERTHELSEAWDVEVVTEDFSGLLRLINPLPESIYIQGDEAQRFHLKTGWVQAASVAAEERVLVENDVIETWFTVANPFAGVPR